VTDGNAGSNYNVSFVNNTTGVINGAAHHGDGGANSRGYDGTNHCGGYPHDHQRQRWQSGTRQFHRSLRSKNVGTGLTLTPAGQ